MDVIKDQLTQIAGMPISTYHKIVHGVTNDNYYVQTMEGHEWVIRIPKPGNHLLFNYYHESIILKTIQPLNLDVPFIRYNDQTGVKITQFVREAKPLTNDQKKDPQKIRQIASMLRHLHGQSLAPTITFNPFEKLALYQTSCRQPWIDLSPYQNLITKIQNSYDQTPKVLCHNDLVPGNLLFSPKRAYLIDYEYAGLNDPWFDVTSFLNENDLALNHPIAQAFVQAYLGHEPSEKTHELLRLWDQFHSLLWATWAMAMHEKNASPELRQIADQKFERLQKSLR